VIIAAAVCPHPPALLPELSGAAADELADVRRASDDAVGWLVAQRPDRVVVLGGGAPSPDRDEAAGGTLAPYGVDVRAGGADLTLALGHTIGAWLLDRAGWTGPRAYVTGATATHGRDALLVMADGSAKRSTAAPGFLDDRAEGFDASVEAALAAGDAAALARLDTALGADLWAAGTPVLRALGSCLAGTRVTAHLDLAAAPFGVAYWVARWQLEPEGESPGR
jgi:hypothetical protein